jgi:hypothetical protein
MNKYFLFWDKIGIFPTHFFLADHALSYPCFKVFQETYKIIKKSEKETYYLLDDSYRLAFNKKGLKNFRAYGKMISEYLKHKDLFDPFIEIKNVIYFKRMHDFNAPLEWGKSLDENLFFYRGSLTVLINLLSLLSLGNTIKLLGIDLNSRESFYQDEIDKRSDLWDIHRFEEIQNKQNFHATAMIREGQLGIQSQWKFLNENAQKFGKTIVCCNPKSLLIQENLCEYRPIIE